MRLSAEFLAAGAANPRPNRAPSLELRDLVSLNAMVIVPQRERFDRHGLMRSRVAAPLVSAFERIMGAVDA